MDYKELLEKWKTCGMSFNCLVLLYSNTLMDEIFLGFSHFRRNEAKLAKTNFRKKK